MCLVTQLYGFEGSTHGPIADFMPLASGLGSLSLLFEATSRQSEIALYVTTKTLEIMHGFARRRGLKADIPHSSVYLFGFAMAVLGHSYLEDPATIKHSYLSVFNKVIGPV